MADMFSQMSRAFRYDRRPPEFLLTHPVSESRVSDARNQASRHARRSYGDDLDFQLMRARVRVHYSETAADAVRLFEGEVQTGRTERQEAARYGLALALAQSGDTRQAIDVITRLYDSEPQRIAYLVAYAEILVRAGHHQRAVDLLDRELKIHPDNLPIAMTYVDALNAAGRHKEAQHVLQRQALLRPIDDDIWYELAETAGLAGDIITVHRARAEYFQLNGNFHSAIQHLEYALQLVPRDDFSQYARLQQRAEDLKDMRREQG